MSTKIRKSFRDGVKFLNDTPVPITTEANGGIELPRGNDGDRPGAPKPGTIRFNTLSESFEGWDGSVWGTIGGETIVIEGQWELPLETATLDLTLFTPALQYDPAVGNVAVYLDGVRQGYNSFTLTDTTTITLNNPAPAGTTVTVALGSDFSPSGLQSFVDQANAAADRAEAAANQAGVKSTWLAPSDGITTLDLTQFTPAVSYNPATGNVAVYANGERIWSDDLTYTDANTIGLSDPINSGTEVEIVVNEIDASTQLQNYVNVSSEAAQQAKDAAANLENAVEAEFTVTSPTSQLNLTQFTPPIYYDKSNENIAVFIDGVKQTKSTLTFVDSVTLGVGDTLPVGTHVDVVVNYTTSNNILQQYYIASMDYAERAETAAKLLDPAANLPTVAPSYMYDAAVGPINEEIDRNSVINYIDASGRMYTGQWDIFASDYIEDRYYSQFFESRKNLLQQGNNYTTPWTTLRGTSADAADIESLFEDSHIKTTCTEAGNCNISQYQNTPSNAGSWMTLSSYFHIGSVASNRTYRLRFFESGGNSIYTAKFNLDDFDDINTQSIINGVIKDNPTGAYPVYGKIVKVARDFIRLEVTARLEIAMTNFNASCGLENAQVGDIIRHACIQMEYGQNASPYIHTTINADIVRPESVVDMLSNGWLSHREGTFVIKYRKRSQENNRTLIQLGTFDKGIRVECNGPNDGDAYILYTDNGSQIIARTDKGIIPGINIIAARYANNDNIAVSVNGEVVTQSNVGEIDVSNWTKMFIGRASNGKNLNAWIEQVIYYPRAVTDVELSALSAR